MSLRSFTVACTVALSAATAAAQQKTTSQRVGAADLAPPLVALVAQPESELRAVVSRYTTDRAALLRRYDVRYGTERRARLRDFERAWQARMREIDFDRLGPEGRIDHILLTKRLGYELSLLDREDKQVMEMVRFAPFFERLTALPEERRRLEPPDAAALARVLTVITKAIDSARTAVDSASRGPKNPDTVAVRKDRIIAYRTANALDGLRRNELDRWYNYYAGYDPTFTRWIRDPWKRADEAVTRDERTLRERIVGY